MAISHKLLEDICIELNNCADCMKTCNAQHILTCNQNLQITSDKSFYIDPYDEAMNARLIHCAETHRYHAGLIADHGCEYLEFIKN